MQALAASQLLQLGRNEVRYSIGESDTPAGHHGAICVRAFLYLWRHASPVVIFDIDGTVTLNDLAGQAAMIVDGSPTHPGVCELLCQLQARGYNVLYLTSRPLLGHCGIERTRRFLFEVAVDTPSGHRMPPAGVLTTTHVATLQALTAELSGASKAFKANALKPIRDAFGVQAPASAEERGGLFAGFGNREKDALAYLSAGVPPERIFLVEPSSKIVGRAAVIALPTHMGDSVPTPQRRTWESYATMLASLDELFPSRRGTRGDQEATIPLPAAPAAIDRDGRVPTDAVPFLM